MAKRRIPRPVLGVPYVSTVREPDGSAHVVCPFCQERVVLARKDWESFSTREYAVHVEQRHPEEVVRG